MTSQRFLLIGLVLAASAVASEPQLSRVTLRVEGDRVLVSFELSGAFDAEMRQRIESGLPTGVLFELEMHRLRRAWWDETVATSELQVVAMYNAVTREYLLNTKLDGKLIESRTVAGADALESAMTSFTDLDLFGLGGLAEDDLVRVRARADLGSRASWLIPRRLRSAWRETEAVEVGGRRPGGGVAP